MNTMILKFANSLLLLKDQNETHPRNPWHGSNAEANWSDKTLSY